MSKSLLAAAAFGAALLASTQAQAVVYNPYNAAGSTETVLSVTPGYTQSYWVTTSSGPANDSPNTVETFTETLTSLSLDNASNVECTGSGREGLTGNNNFAASNRKCVGNVFTLKVNNVGYLVFVYATALALDAFDIQMDALQGNASKLSHMDVYNSVPSPVPVPPALVLLASGLAGIGAVARRKRKAA